MNTTHNNTTISELNLKSNKKLAGKKKVKGEEDDVVDYSMGSDGKKPAKKGTRGDKDADTDEKLRTGSADSTKKPTKGNTKGKVSDDKVSRSSHDSNDHHKGKIIR